jgi:hypothetical protein
MTKAKVSHAQAIRIRKELAAIIKDHFDNDGAVITHDDLATAQVDRNKSRRADQDVKDYGPEAVTTLRDQGYAIVPITARFPAGDPTKSRDVNNAVAGAGSGGNRMGWYQPSDEDDPYWIAYVGHQGKSGVAMVFHASKQDANRPTLLSATGRKAVAEVSVDALPKAEPLEQAVLSERN